MGVARCASSLASRGTSTSLSNRDIDNAQTRTSTTELPCTSPARNSRALPPIFARSPSNPADICHSPYDGRETHPYGTVNASIGDMYVDIRLFIMASTHA